MTKSYSYIQKKHYDKLDEIITFTKYKIKSSASESFIFTGVLKSNNMDVFCKFFTINKESLIYEKNIYNFINQFGEENMIFFPRPLRVRKFFRKVQSEVSLVGVV